MRMKASALLVLPTTLAKLKLNYFIYLDKAIADIDKGATSLVTTWFGAVGVDQIAAIRTGLVKLKTVCESYSVGVSKTKTERLIEWTTMRKDVGSIHSPDTFAAAFAWGVGDMNKHFTLRIYAGLLLTKQTYDWVVNTMYHELSHRVLATADVKHVSTGGNPAYGEVYVKALAAAAPAEAMTNASNWAYFINACNGQTDWPQ